MLSFATPEHDMKENSPNKEIQHRADKRNVAKTQETQIYKKPQLKKCHKIS